MLADGAHVSIDGISCILARDNDNKLLYNDSHESLFANTQAIAGEIAKEQLRPTKMLWSLTDWSGGEGAVVYYPQNPTQYDQGLLMNVTKRGQLTTRTKRRRAVVARTGTNADTGKRPVGVSAYTHAVIAWEDNIIVSSDCISWSGAQDATPDMSGADWADAVSDGANAWFLPAAGGAADATPTVAVPTSTTAWADTNTGTYPDPPIVGMFLNGVGYSWGLNGSSLLELNYQSNPLATAEDWTANQAYVSAIAPSGTWGTDYWTAATAAETSGYISYSTKSHAFVWEVRDNVTRPFWNAPTGFAIKELIYHMGVLFAIGNQHAAGNSFATLWAIPIATQTPLIAAEPRRHQNVTLSSFSLGCAANGPHLFLADENSGKIFLYDIERDALSLFDDLANGGTGDSTDFVASTNKIAFLAMHGARMFLATWGESDTSLQIISYDDLEVQNRDAAQAISANLESADWDFGLPMETKALLGFYVTYKITDAATTSGLVANSRITISYSMDDASYSTTVASGASATITSATTPVGQKGRHFIQVSDGTTTQKFTRLKVKITLDNNSQAVAPPIVYGVTVEAVPMGYERTWDLVLQVEDEEQNDRPSSAQRTGSALRTSLIALASNKDVVTFLDGAWNKNPNTYTTHTVVVENPTSRLVDSLGNGQVAVRLRSIV